MCKFCDLELNRQYKSLLGSDFRTWPEEIKDYEIHHCFGYDDPSKFIYISKSLHIKIHQYLRDNNIDADSNHYDYIKHMINECEEYTYISV